MIATNFFRGLAEFFTNVLFAPYDALRFTEGWWVKSFFNWILFGITSLLFIYWLVQLQKFKKAGTE
jgi:hypothetical protein